MNGESNHFTMLGGSHRRNVARRPDRGGRVGDKALSGAVADPSPLKSKRAWLQIFSAGTLPQYSFVIRRGNCDLRVAQNAVRHLKLELAPTAAP